MESSVFRERTLLDILAFVYCPKCRSPRITGPEWWSDESVYVTCRDCGHNWNAAHNPKEPHP